MAELGGKVAVITGASQGMGEAHSRRFVAEGAQVVMVDINAERGEAIASELGKNATFIEADVTKKDDWRMLLREAESTYGLVTVLVNNAGVLGPIAETAELEEDDFHATCMINQYSQYYGMKYAIPSMQRAGGGSIINVSSIAGLVSIVGSPNIAYVGSKFASRGMTKHAAAQYGKDNIRVNSVHPGYIKTPMMAEATDEEGGGIASQVPLGRMADADEVARLVVWLASDGSSYVSGTEQVIDGGLTAQ